MTQQPADDDTAIAKTSEFLCSSFNYTAPMQGKKTVAISDVVTQLTNCYPFVHTVISQVKGDILQS